MNNNLLRLLPYVLLITVFVLYIVFNPLIIGYDSYFFLSKICNNENIGISVGNPLLFNYFISLLPCNFVVLKIILLISALTALFFLEKFILLFSDSEEEKNLVWFSK